MSSPEGGHCKTVSDNRRRKGQRLKSELGHGSGLKALLSLLEFVLNFVTIIEFLETVTLNDGIVNENILRTVIRANESITLASIEEFHSTCSHNKTTLSCQATENDKESRLPVSCSDSLCKSIQGGYVNYAIQHARNDTKRHNFLFYTILARQKNIKRHINADVR